MLYGEKSTTTTAIVTVVSSQEAKDGKRCLITKVCAIMRSGGIVGPCMLTLKDIYGYN